MKSGKWKTGKRRKPRNFLFEFSILSIGPKSKSRKRKSQKMSIQRRSRRFRIFDLAFFLKIFQFYWSMVLCFALSNGLNDRKIQTIPKVSVLL